MRIDVSLADTASPALRELVRRTLPERRRTAVEATLADALADTIQTNPVDTARSRAAWVTSLEQLGGRPSAGWQGPQPTGEAEGRSAGALARQHDRDSSSAAATNAVAYVPFLEYGTSRMGPFAMVRRSLQLARDRLLARLRSIVE